MARKTTKNATIDANSVSIAEFCQSQGINEQIFRLELMQYQDTADSAKTVDFDVARQVVSTLSATSKALPETLETAETLTPQGLQPSTELATNEPQKPQNSDIVANSPSTPITPGQGQNKPLPTALTELIAASQESIELADLVHVYRNEQILANSQTRDNELILRLREQRIENRQATFDQLRELNSRQPIAPELPELPAALSDEIDALSRELGKQLNLS